jgi:streptogramin lyase
MSTTRLALYLLFSGLVAGCATNGSGDDNGGDDDGDVPFTSGVSTLAGSAEAGYVDGARKVARFSNPVNVAFHDGKVYVADFDNSKLRAIDATTHVTNTVIVQQGFQRPFGMVFAPDGTFYVSTDNDPTGAHNPMSGTIWRVDVNAKKATAVATAIGRPRGMAVLSDGRIAVADYLHHVIEIVDPKTGKATTIAGAFDAPGMVDGAMASARFSHPQGMVAAANGDVYLTDLGNYRIRKIAGDQITTVAGNGMAGAVDNDDPLMSELYGLEGVSVVPDGSMLYIADGNRGEAVPFNRVRQVKLH